ncbi:MAG TPA: glycosyltransferase family 9 protein [Nitrospinota bacterium]|jgi:heptosyltransferase-2|nr:glycosyltransferase family 9 protein [Anaerolineales bacterium]HJM82339.1 glycosyltransferase family 9 protein [Nitrospinota bacterium]|tara:strand:+ start:107790 stop:108836 length:1047 start_codon:yes stop_codon:yes gene_type:complete
MNLDTIKVTEKPRILVVRTDRIGDLTLSLPVFTSLRATFPKAHICALTRKYTSEILQNRADIDQTITFDSDKSNIPVGQFCNVVSLIRRGKFDVGIALYLNNSIALALLIAGIPIRIGPATKLAQIGLNHKIKQRRSKSNRHEADHNLDLLKPLGAEIIRESKVYIPDSTPLLLGAKNGKPRVGIHPGHGGSSLNWPKRYYGQLIGILEKSGLDVYLTGSENEQDLLEEIALASGGKPKTYVGTNGIMELAKVLSELDVFVASSTGPLHLASAVGTPVVGIYCPIYVCLPERWGPIGKHDTAIRPMMEPCKVCNSICNVDCMATIDIEQVRIAILSKISNKTNKVAGY